MKTGEVVDILSGFAFNSKLFNDRGEGTPIVRIRDVGKEKTDTYFSGDYNSDFLLENGDLLIGMDGDFRLAEWRGGPALLNQRVCKINPKNGLIHRRYLMYFLPKQLKRIEDTTSFATVKHLSVKKIKDIEIPLPPLATQQKIAAILDKADELRQNDKQILEKYDQLTQSVFLEMFGDPVTNPMGWEVHNIRESAEIVRDGPFGSNLKSAHYRPKGIRVIRLQNIGVNKFLDDDKAYISEEHYQTISKHTCRAGDILVATLGDPNVRACKFPAHLGKAINKADCVQIRPKKELLIDTYLVNLLNNPATLYWVSNMLHGQTRTRVSMGQLSKLDIPIPPVKIQNIFAEQIDQIEKQKQLTQQSLIMSEELFQSLLQRAFKGELV